MGSMQVALRELWIACPEGRLVVVPEGGGGDDVLPLRHGVAVRGQETQIGVGADERVLIHLRDQVGPAVFEREITATKSGIWVGTIRKPCGIRLSVEPGRYLLSIWFDTRDDNPPYLLQLGLTAAN